MANKGTTRKLFSLMGVLAMMVLMLAPLVPARAQEELPNVVVTATPSAIYVGEDAAITLTMAGEDGQVVKEGTQVIISIDALGFAVTGTVGAKGFVTATLPSSKLTVGAFTGKVLVEGYKEGTFTLEVAGKKLALEPVSATVVFAQELTLEATLYDAQEEKPLEKGTQALLLLPKGGVTATVGDEGLVQFTVKGPDHLVVGTSTVFISVEGYADAPLVLNVEPGNLIAAPESFEVGFAKTVTLTFKVAEKPSVEAEAEEQEQKGTPLPEGTVLWLTFGDYTDTVTVGEEGSATVTLDADVLKVGETTELGVKADGYNLLSVPVKVNTGTLKVEPAELTVKGTEDVVFTATLTDGDGNDVPHSLNDEQLVATLTVDSLTATAAVGKNSKVTFTLPASAMEELGGGSFEGEVSLVNFNKAVFKLTITDLPKKEEPQPPEEPTTITLELTVGSNTLKVSGEAVEMDVAPYLKDGRVMVPVRFLAEALGLPVDYDFSDPTNKIVTVHAVEDIVLTIGSNKALVGTQEVELDAAPEIVNSRTMVPVRFIAETLGFDVQWADGVVTLTQKEQP